MLATLQRLITRSGRGTNDLGWLEDWARRRHDTCKRVRGVEGFVIEGALQGRPYRLECGPPQRSYMQGPELRIRAELGLPPALEMLVLTRGVAEFLEIEAYESLTQAQQTAVETTLPEEGRWLSMYEHLAPETLPNGLGAACVAVGAHPLHASRWLEGELATRLARARAQWLGDAPLVLMTLRGRLYVRTGADALDEGFLDGLLGLADSAAARALQLVADGLPTRRSRYIDDDSSL